MYLCDVCICACVYVYMWYMCIIYLCVVCICMWCIYVHVFVSVVCNVCRCVCVYVCDVYLYVYMCVYMMYVSAYMLYVMYLYNVSMCNIWCMYVCLYVCICVGGACMLCCTCGDQRTASDIGPRLLPSCWLLRKPWYLARSFCDCRSSASHLSVGVLGLQMHTGAPGFCWVLDTDLIHVFMFA